MNLRDLKYLVEVAEQKHFGKAAEICCVSQPALSMQIKKLEDSLGVQLLERTNKSVFLTEIGMVVAEQARQILSRVVEMKAAAKLAQNPFAGELQLGIIPTLAPYLLPHIIPSLSRLFPELELYLVEEQTAVLTKKLQQGKLDAAILALPLLEEEFVSVPLFEEEFLLAVPDKHHLAKRKIIKQKELESETLLLLKNGHCMREQALAVCFNANASESKNFTATSLETLRHMVMAGMGITLVPKLAYKENDGISYVQFSAPKPSRTVGVIWRRSTAKETLLNEMVVQIKKVMAKKNYR